MRAPDAHPERALDSSSRIEIQLLSYVGDAGRRSIGKVYDAVPGPTSWYSCGDMWYGSTAIILLDQDRAWVWRGLAPASAST